MRPAELAERLGCADLKEGQSRKVSSPLREDLNPSLNVTLKPGGVWTFMDFGDDSADSKEFYGRLVEAIKLGDSRNGDPPHVESAEVETLDSYSRYLQIPRAF